MFFLKNALVFYIYLTIFKKGQLVILLTGQGQICLKNMTKFFNNIFKRLTP